MSTTRNRRLIRSTGFLVVALAAMAAVLATPSTASAADQDTPAVITDPYFYLANSLTDESSVLHVDSEHADADGFWYAIGTGFTGATRDMMWVYQPYGADCQYATDDLAWNGWMNTYWCVLDEAAIDATTSPGFAAKSEQCRTASGLPFLVSDGYTGCSRQPLNWGGNRVAIPGNTWFTCAPWEDQSLGSAGSAKCRTQSYPWLDDPKPNTFWSPAPDTCTGMPVEANRPWATYRDPANFAPTSGDGSCTGAALAPNCPPSSTHRACTGVEPAAQQYATATATRTATGSGTATMSASATRDFRALTITETATDWFRGKKYSAEGSASFYTEATREASAARTVSGVERSATETRSCAAETVQAAQECAQEAAAAAALASAQVEANATARSEARDAARAAAKTAAAREATAAARDMPVTSRQKAETRERAERRALENLRAKMN